MEFLVSRYVGVDISIGSLKEFVNLRILDKDSKLISNGNKDFRKISHLVCADMGSDSLTQSDNLMTHFWEDGYFYYSLILCYFYNFHYYYCLNYTIIISPLFLCLLLIVSYCSFSY